MAISGLLSMSCYVILERKMSDLIRDIDEICEMVKSCTFGIEESITDGIQRDGILFSRIHGFLSIYQFASPFIFCINGLVMNYNAGNYGEHLPWSNNCSFELHPAIFEVCSFFQVYKYCVDSLIWFNYFYFTNPRKFMKTSGLNLFNISQLLMLVDAMKTMLLVGIVPTVHRSLHFSNAHLVISVSCKLQISLYSLTFSVLVN